MPRIVIGQFSRREDAEAAPPAGLVGDAQSQGVETDRARVERPGPADGDGAVPTGPTHAVADNGSHKVHGDKLGASVPGKR